MNIGDWVVVVGKHYRGIVGKISAVSAKGDFAVDGDGSGDIRLFSEGSLEKISERAAVAIDERYESLTDMGNKAYQNTLAEVEREKAENARLRDALFRMWEEAVELGCSGSHAVAVSCLKIEQIAEGALGMSYIEGRVNHPPIVSSDSE